jgi:4-diphosphocytidyl-2-C-methyl-D-erythritol kinase
MTATKETKEKLVYQSPAKVNLGLEVLGKRSDGYHSIRSILVPITLHDTITITPGGKRFVFHGGQGAPKDEGNLAWRAVNLLAERAGIRRGLDVKIVKRIPIAAGLGGGSSNAAIVLKALNELWELDMSAKEIERIGLELGSDVPFFLRGGACFAGGRGEELQQVAMSGTVELVLVAPAIKVSSQWAYENIPAELTRSGSSTSMIKVALASNRVELLAAHLSNDLEPGVVAKHPMIADIKKKLVAAGALGAQMSGSGPTVFGLAATAVDADRIAATMAETTGFGKVIRASFLVG